MELANIMYFIKDLGLDIIMAAIPAVGFALLFNVPPKALKYCAILGGLGHGLRFTLLHMGASIIPSTFAVALCIGFAGVYFARKFHAHPKVVTVASLIPMIPGVLAYKATLAILGMYQNGFSNELFTKGLISFLDAIGIIAVLAFGLALPGMIFYRRKPVI